jgi:hypothetical protein
VLQETDVQKVMPFSAHWARRYSQSKIMRIFFVKSLLTSLFQREGKYPSLAKRGKGRFSYY